MSRWMEWLSRNGHTLVVGAACFLLGVAASLPLGWKLSDPVLTLFGSVAGIAGTIGGAVLLWRMQMAHEGKVLQAHLLFLLTVVVEDIGRLVAELRDPGYQGEKASFDVLARSLEEAQQAISGSLGRLHTLPTLAYLGVSKASGFVRLTSLVVSDVLRASSAVRANGAVPTRKLLDEYRTVFVGIVQEINSLK